MIYGIVAAAAAEAECMNATYSQTLSFVAFVASPTTVNNLTRITTKTAVPVERKQRIGNFERKKTPSLYDAFCLWWSV